MSIYSIVGLQCSVFTAVLQQQGSSIQVMFSAIECVCLQLKVEYRVQCLYYAFFQDFWCKDENAEQFGMAELNI